MKWILRIGAVLFLLWWVRRFWLWLAASGWKRLLSSLLQTGITGRPAPRERSGLLKQDPVCGIFVDVTLAVTEAVDGEQVYFCSEECRQKYLVRRRQPQPSAPVGRHS